MSRDFRSFLKEYKIGELKKVSEKLRIHLHSKIKKDELINRLHAQNHSDVLDAFTKEQLRNGSRNIGIRGISNLNKPEIIQRILDHTRNDIETENRRIRRVLLELSKGEERFREYESKAVIFTALTLSKQYKDKESVPIAGLYLRVHYNQVIEMTVLLKGDERLSSTRPYFKNIPAVEQLVQDLRIDPTFLLVEVYDHLITLQSKMEDETEQKELEYLISSYHAAWKVRIQGRQDKEHGVDNLHLHVVLISGQRTEYESNKNALTERGLSISGPNLERLELYKKHCILDIRSYDFLREPRSTEYVDYIHDVGIKKIHREYFPEKLTGQDGGRQSSESASNAFALPFDELPHFFAHYEVHPTASLQEKCLTIFDLIQNALKYVGTILLAGSLPRWFTCDRKEGIEAFVLAKLKEPKIEECQEIRLNDGHRKIFMNDSLGKIFDAVETLLKNLKVHDEKVDSEDWGTFWSDLKSEYVHSNTNAKLKTKWTKFKEYIASERNTLAHEGFSTFDMEQFVQDVQKPFLIVRDLLSRFKRFQLGVLSLVPDGQEDPEYNSYYWFASVGRSIYHPPVILKFKKECGTEIPKDQAVLLDKNLQYILPLSPFITYNQKYYYWLNVKGSQKGQDINIKAIELRNMSNRNECKKDSNKQIDAHGFRGWISMQSWNHPANRLFSKFEQHDYFEIVEWIINSDQYFRPRFLGYADADDSSLVFEVYKIQENTKEPGKHVTLKFALIQNGYSSSEQEYLGKLKDVQGIPKNYGVARAETRTQIYYYFEMEYVEGEPLNTWLLAHNRTPDFQILKDIVNDVVKILEEMYQKKVIHGFLKLENIIVKDPESETRIVSLVDLSMVEKLTEDNRSKDLKDLKSDIQDLSIYSNSFDDIIKIIDEKIQVRKNSLEV